MRREKLSLVILRVALKVSPYTPRPPSDANFIRPAPAAERVKGVEGTKGQRDDIDRRTLRRKKKNV